MRTGNKGSPLNFPMEVILPILQKPGEQKQNPQKGAHKALHFELLNTYIFVPTLGQLLWKFIVCELSKTVFKSPKLES